MERVQTGIRIEKRLLKVMKATAEYLDLSLGDLVEGVFLHAFDGQCAFSEPTRRKIAELKRVYEVHLDASASHRMIERSVD